MHRLATLDSVGQLAVFGRLLRCVYCALRSTVGALLICRDDLLRLMPRCVDLPDILSIDACRGDLINLTVTAVGVVFTGSCLYRILCWLGDRVLTGGIAGSHLVLPNGNYVDVGLSSPGYNLFRSGL
ncbi:hypothetical protein Nepgr_007799 [Nepenthes gracilis]|uniref:Uncharacterized protein n=1 Tax=Nepenthes gracilis TaxID=150966 RepID=A0AAD3S7S7_NEPGR|nr:hypothetical protein Nepgr_007799 [Nepenthes gracilis]